MTENETTAPEPVEDGAGALIMGKTGVVQKPGRKPRKKAVEEIPSDKTIVFSQGNLDWTGVGKLTPGFNVVTKEAAAQWVTLKKVREASVEEVKEFYGR